ncbi:MAG: hypothetical protein GKR89_18710 [Candidatus Latescibacteria bacterium]|nr:hypothetical protein [Candidatus Latescibacterota bacterium]
MTQEEFDQHVLHMQLQGYAVLPAILTPDECAEGIDQLNRLARQREQGGFELLFNKARIFERSYQVPQLIRFIRHFLGADALLSSMHGSILPPGSGGGGLHADGAITGHNRSQSLAAADGQRRITSHIIALNTIHCLTPFTATNGATQLVPGSHLYDGLDLPADHLRQARIVAAEAGSVLVFNVNTWHGSSANQSEAARYAVLNPWRRQWTRCEYEVARLVKPEVVDRAGEDGKIIFGQGATPPYLEMWQWDREQGGPKGEWAHLHRA